ncbi:hypothetical protein [Stutzerimonas stutzeri]|uniref:DNA gyrase subunit B n=1 Tax=Stutzerimonas stutzeri TaxID=316 RepID=A0A6I6LSG4_STUST|nr:hypothetical protein [Stutzerimonas stutzeri]QGZ29652.1 hypothetical protein GQA94_06040 [Stutzerimonas stutzeri]
MQATARTGKANTSRLIALALLLAGLTYPFAVYLGLEHLSPRLFAVLLGMLWLARLLSGKQTPVGRRMTTVALLFCLFLGLAGDPALLRWYPVLISLALLGLFAGSLRSGMPIIERLARLREPELPPAAVRYTRQVTWLWTGYFIINASIAGALALWAPLSWWTLYTGLIAYLLMGMLFAGEWLVRQRIRNVK